MSLSPQSDFAKALEDKDTQVLRRVLLQFLKTDLVGAPVALDAVEQCAPEVWDPHDGLTVSPEEHWNDLYLKRLEAHLAENFSRETYLHALQVCEALKARSAAPVVREPRGMSRWVSIVFVIGLTLLGAIVLFGPPVLRVILSNSGLMG